MKVLNSLKQTIVFKSESFQIKKNDKICYFFSRYERTQIDIGGWLKSLSNKNPHNQNSYIGRKSCTLPRLGDGPPDLEAFKDAVKPKTSGNFCLQRKPAPTFSSNHGNQNQGSKGSSSGKEDPFAFADNLTANFMKNKGHTRNRFEIL